ncbi:MAG: hypothetical protein HQ581_22930 [Planctomycetes bacterium]|nr:hypothetical protein [Planctomycetota bacterium]
MLFPDAAITILRQAHWRPDAERDFELMSGGFVWSDEHLGEIALVCTEVDNWAFREVIAYRASLTRNAPRPELREPWDQLRRECPDWPGFHPERSDHSLNDALDAENEEAMRQLHRMSDVCERAQRINAIREKRKRKWWKLW